MYFSFGKMFTNNLPFLIGSDPLVEEIPIYKTIGPPIVSRGLVKALRSVGNIILREF